jgi:hypothetical protein
MLARLQSSARALFRVSSGTGAPDNRLDQEFRNTKRFPVERPSPLPPREIAASLPDEMLAEVFSYSVLMDYRPRLSDYQECIPLTLVSKRWRRLSEPLLYRRIDLGPDGW